MVFGIINHLVLIFFYIIKAPSKQIKKGLSIITIHVWKLPIKIMHKPDQILL